MPQCNHLSARLGMDVTTMSLLQFFTREVVMRRSANAICFRLPYLAPKDFQPLLLISHGNDPQEGTRVWTSHNMHRIVGLAELTEHLASMINRFQADEGYPTVLAKVRVECRRGNSTFMPAYPKP
eukprot:352544-Chlamydomonas_euryale.AAC.24